MRLALAVSFALLAAAASAAEPVDRWDAKAREIFARSIEIPTVPGRG